MNKLKAAYIVGLIVIGALIISISFQTQHHAVSSNPEVSSSFIETDNEKIVSFKIHNTNDTDQNYRVTIFSNSRETGDNTILVKANRTWEYAKFLPTEEAEDTKITILIWREDELIHNKTRRL